MEIIFDKLSPMMQTYWQTKENYKDCLLLYRLGDFYELFFDDAKVASKVLDIALTGRACGLEERAPMCGVPYHAVDSYVAKLLEAGYKVAICDQLSEPQKGKMVERDVTRVITPGTVIEGESLDEGKNNYILSLCKTEEKVGACFSDVSTGEFKLLQFDGELMSNLKDFLSRIKPAEIICNEDMLSFSAQTEFKTMDFLPPFTKREETEFDLKSAETQIKTQFKIESMSGHAFYDLKVAMRASGALLNYLFETQKRALPHINKIAVENNADYMMLDYNATKNLELLQNVRDGKKHGSLLGHLNKTKTPMGLRLLTKWVTQPLQDEKEINSRLDCVEELYYNYMLQSDIAGTLSNINDIARVCAKISFDTITPRDCLSLKNSLFAVVDLANYVKELKNDKFKSMFQKVETVKGVATLLDKAIDENAPAITTYGGYIKENFNDELYKLKNTATESKKWLARIEAQEKEYTGIKTLKIGYSRVFGYYIEIPRSQIKSVPYRYQRKQTVANAERFTTEDLKDLESRILNAEEVAIKLEYIVYDKIKSSLREVVNILQDVANEVAYVDVISSLSQVAKTCNYVRPLINKDVKHILIEDGRHPIVESNLKANTFVPNDTYLNCEGDRTLIITGPNMAGKSTYMRQIALITIMAHVGSFVPASKAEISLTDRIFTRIGASDDLNSGQSTFMVEMVDVANIINNATASSLVLLDEVGRGTSTYDGMSIAWAVLEHISQKIKCKTLFSTHYHEITALEGKLEGVKNYKVCVKEFNNSVIFLRKVMKGSADRSFGIEVAALSGIYDGIISRAKGILRGLEENSTKVDLTKQKDTGELSTREKDSILNSLKEIDVNKLTPIDAFEIIANIKKQLEN